MRAEGFASPGDRISQAETPDTEAETTPCGDQVGDTVSVLQLLNEAAATSRVSFGVGVGLLAVSAALAVTSSLLFAPLFDQAILPGDMRLIALIAGAQLALTAGRSIISAAGTSGLARFGASIAQALAERLHNEMARQPLGYFISTGRGAMLQLLRSDVAVLEAGAGFQAGQCLVAGLQIAIGLLAIGVIDPVLLILAALGLCGAALWSRVAVRWQAEDLRREINANIRVADLMLLNLGIDGALLRIQSNPDWVESRVAGALKEHAVRVVNRRSRGNWVHEASNITIAAAQFGFFLVGGALVGGQSLSIGELIAAAALLMLLSGGAQQLVGAISGLADAAARLDRMAKTLTSLQPVGRREKSVGHGGSRPVIEASPTVRFENVSLSYLPGMMAIQDACFACPAGALTALVGPSGAGKSSLLYLLLRLVAPDTGDITLAGIDHKAFSRDELWKAIGFVPQDPPFFAASVRDNLTLGRSASDRDIELACREAGILHRVLASPDGFDADMGESGYRFSAGERKRLAIARALIGRPFLLILDEPTANVDPESEKAIIASMRANASNGLTVVLVTHSAAAAAAADSQVRIEQGRVYAVPEDGMIKETAR